jgi:hypothetical protein
MTEDDTAAEGARSIDEDARFAKSRLLATTAIQGKRATNEFDIFLSYNSKDRDTVIAIAEMLKEVGLRAWLDVWNLIPGKPWQGELEQAIEGINCAAICVGPGGIGPWEEQEMRAYLEAFVCRQDVRVMPVLLPGLDAVPDLPIFLRAFTWVDLRELRQDSREPLRGLVAGTLGRSPDDFRHDALDAALVKRLTVPPPPIPDLSSEDLQITLHMKQKDSKIEDFDLEAVRLQMAERLGIDGKTIKITDRSKGSVIVTFQFSNPSDLALLLGTVRAGRPDIIEMFEHWKASPQEFLKENKAVADILSEVFGGGKQPIQITTETGDIHIGNTDQSVSAGKVEGSAISTGQSGGTQTQINQATGLDINTAIAALRALGEELEIGDDEKRALERNLQYAEQESNEAIPDKSIISATVTKAMNALKSSAQAAKNIETLTSAGSSIASWCGEHGQPILDFIQNLG